MLSLIHICWADIDDVGEALGLALPGELYDTFGGFICGVLDEIPEDGAEAYLETDDLIIKVHSVESHRIGCTTVEKKTPAEAAAM